jgi:sec-independent protein translocase protein TatA
MNTLALLGMSGGNEMLIVLAVVLLLFGSKRLPELSRALGKSLSEFKKGQHEGARPDPVASKEEE